MDKLALDLFSTELNIQELDERPCSWCREVPIIKVVTRTADGRFLKHNQHYIDRSSRIDCDGAVKNQQSKLMTYHIKCWKEACESYV